MSPVEPRRQTLCPHCRRLQRAGITHCTEDGAAVLPIAWADSARIGDVIDERFTLLSVLGEGGVGCVYRALQHSMEREVALKLLHPHYTQHEEAVARFLREARVASRLTHPNLVSLFDFGRCEGGELYLAMELLEGRSLRELLEDEGRLAPQRVVALGTQICDALTHAHASELVHRDLKPENIFVTEGAGMSGEFVRVLDFGIAQVPSDLGTTRLTATGIVCGTPEYISPEQAQDENLGPQSDLYSLAVVLFEALMGWPPFEDESGLVVMLAHVEQPVPAMAGIPAGLTVAVRAALAKDPGSRPASAEAFKSALLLALTQDASAAAEAPFRPALPVRRAGAPASKDRGMGWWPWLFAGGLAVGLFVAGVVWAFSEPAVQENSKDTPPPTEPRPLEENTRGAAEPLEPLEKPAEDVGDRPEAIDLHLVPSEGSEPSVDRSRRSHHAPPTEAGTDRGRAPPESEPVKRAAVQRENPRSRRGIDRSWWREESTGSGVRPMVAPAERPIQPLPLDARPQPEGDGGPSDTAPAPGEASSL